MARDGSGQSWERGASVRGCGCFREASLLKRPHVHGGSRKEEAAQRSLKAAELSGRQGQPVQGPCGQRVLDAAQEQQGAQLEGRGGVGGQDVGREASEVGGGASCAPFQDPLSDPAVPLDLPSWW